MAKTPIKKSSRLGAAKKSSHPSVAKKVATSKNSTTKNKKVAKVPLSEKQELQKEANRIANIDKKKKPSNGKRPIKNTTTQQTSSLLDAIVEGMKEKKAKRITIIDLRELEHRVCDYFVICDSDSNTHVNAIANSVEDVVVKRTGEKPYRSEGYQNAEWILVDYVNIVAHIFLRDSREFYNIEGLWADGKITNIED